MPEDSAEENGAADAGAAAGADAGVPPIPVGEPLASVAGPAAIAAARKADVFSVGASAAGHLLVGMLIFGALATAQTPPQAIPVKLIPANQAPHKPPLHLPPLHLPPQKKVATPQPKQPPKQQKQTLPPKPQAAKAAKGKPGTGKAPPPPAKAESAGKKKSIPWSRVAAALGMANYGRKTTVPPALLSRLRAQAKRCWTIPSGWNDPRQVAVTLRFQLNPDGTLAGEPAVVEFPATSLGTAAAKAAIKAVKACGPYRLPVAQYAQWKDIQLELRP